MIIVTEGHNQEAAEVGFTPVLPDSKWWTVNSLYPAISEGSYPGTPQTPSLHGDNPEV